MNYRIICVFLVSFGLGVISSYLILIAEKDSLSLQEKVSDSLPVVGGELQYRLDDSEWGRWFSSFSGDWVSVDGRQLVRLENGVLYISDSFDWPDLDHRTFIIGEDMQFVSHGNVYNITASDDHDVMYIIMRDSYTEDLCGFTLYREGTSRARLHAPIPDVDMPVEVRSILEAIPKLKKGDLKDDVVRVIGIDKIDGLELLDKQSNLGGSDLVYSLGIDDHWMLRIGYSRERLDEDSEIEVIRRVQVVRGYVEDVRNGYQDIEKLVYPYFALGKVICNGRIDIEPGE